MAGCRRGGRFEAELHAEAQRLLAEADDPARVKQTILMALRGGRPVQQKCLICGKVAQHCQLWVPMELTQAVPDLNGEAIHRLALRQASWPGSQCRHCGAPRRAPACRRSGS
jgi:hypothetical protein